MRDLVWDKDILGDDYQARTLTFPADYQGEALATLVRHRPASVAGPSSGRAVLYVHGYTDYFFQTHVADAFAKQGYDFYALDLRKAGRSIRPHHTPHHIRAISEYFPELAEAVRIIREEEGHDTVVVNAHSTGGLTVSLWADSVRGQGLVDALALNSPFFDFNASAVARRFMPPLVRPISRRAPLRVLPLGVSTVYGRSIHADHDGEWAYDLVLKPLAGAPVTAGWLMAIHAAHRQLHQGLAIDVPVFVACSTHTYRKGGGPADAARMDAVLDVDHIARWTPMLGPHTTLVRVPGGVHDLALSAKQARTVYFDEMFRWLAAYS